MHGKSFTLSWPWLTYYLGSEDSLITLPKIDFLHQLLALLNVRYIIHHHLTVYHIFCCLPPPLECKLRGQELCLVLFFSASPALEGPQIYLLIELMNEYYLRIKNSFIY